MLTFTEKDFCIQTGKENAELRNKLALLGESLSQYAKTACPKRTWGYYVTGKTRFGEQWGAIYPFNVKGNEDFIVNYPGIFYEIPQHDETTIRLAVNCEFKQTRDNLLMEHFRINSTTDKFIQEIKKAKGAKVSILKKEVLTSDHRHYNWIDLWDKKELPEIDVSKCSAEYLNKYITSIKNPPKHENPEWYWESVFLIKYDFEFHEVINNKNVEKLFGEKVFLLSPIIEYIVWGFDI